MDALLLFPKFDPMRWGQSAQADLVIAGGLGLLTEDRLWLSQWPRHRAPLSD